MGYYYGGSYWTEPTVPTKTYSEVFIYIPWYFAIFSFNGCSYLLWSPVISVGQLTVSLLFWSWCWLFLFFVTFEPHTYAARAPMSRSLQRKMCVLCLDLTKTTKKEVIFGAFYLPLSVLSAPPSFDGSHWNSGHMVWYVRTFLDSPRRPTVAFAARRCLRPPLRIIFVSCLRNLIFENFRLRRTIVGWWSTVDGLR